MEYLTKEITLPVSGLTAVVQESYGDPERRLYERIDEIHKALPEYWASLTLRLGDNERVTPDDILDLKVYDQHCLAIEIWRAGSLNDELTLQGDCKFCGKPAGYVVDMGGLSFDPLPEGAETPDPTFEVALPRTAQRVVFGYITGRQEMAEADIEGIDPSRLALRAIRSVDGGPVKLREVSSWPSADIKAVLQAIRSKRCGYDTRVRFKHSCGREVVMDLLTDPSFVMATLVG